MSKVTRAKWAKRVLGAKYFVVLTEKESVICLEGVNPDKFDDILALQTQGAALADFHAKLGVLVKDHAKAASKLLGAKPRSKRATTNRRPLSKTTVKQIKVKQG